MEKKRKNSEARKLRRAKVRLLSPLEQTTRLLQLEQRRRKTSLSFSPFQNRRWRKLRWKRRH